MPTTLRRPTLPAGETVACGALILWAAALLLPQGEAVPFSFARLLQAAAVIWHLLSFYLWLVPRWRRLVIERRGPLLGVGFAFGAAFVSSIADASGMSPLALVGLFLWRLFVYVLPFVPPLAWRLPLAPHPVDGAVTLLALFLPRLPGFDGAWFNWFEANQGGLLQGGLGPGSLGGPALLATYFYGVRPWTAAPLDLKPRPGDGRAALAALFLGSLAAWAAGFFDELEAGRAALEATSPTLIRLRWLLLGAGLSALAEELAFRGIVQAGLSKAFSRGSGRWRALRRLGFALFAAALHAAYGPFGMTAVQGLGLSLAIGLMFARTPRYFPAVLAHSLALAVQAFALL